MLYVVPQLIISASLHPCLILAPLVPSNSKDNIAASRIAKYALDPKHVIRWEYEFPLWILDITQHVNGPLPFL